MEFERLRGWEAKRMVRGCEAGRLGGWKERGRETAVGDGAPGRQGGRLG